eukprot:TRINITY_DN63421_c0_g1_i1.p1 TRINITY_DN63421_c0_g1~~TRINITY_DN63421_c0_g1_i1.p1  ORF type:complete len:342 (+),score=45.96 TRINITY_DN63421_c0_g1_i1:72-1097(+)
MLSVVKLLILAPIVAADVHSEWVRFKQHFGKVYRQNEEAAFFKAFRANFEFIAAENKKEHSYELGITAFADFPLDHTGQSGLAIEGMHNWTLEQSHSRFFEQPVPPSLDWEARGALTPVVNENVPPDGLGACWAFAAVAAVESANKIVNGNLVKLSEQQVVDCSGGGSCDIGGMYFPVWDWLKKSGTALCSEASYPYTCFPGAGGCSTACTKSLPGYAIVGYVNVPRSELQLMSALQQQPVAAAMAGAWQNHPSFRLYKSGVYSSPDCTEADHAVLVVGYGTTVSGGAYWKIKNSYGVEWGMKGYALLKRSRPGNGAANACGVPAWLGYPDVRQMNSVVVL